MQVYDGYDENAPTLLEICSNDLPEPKQSSGDTIFVKFISSFYKVGNWFHMKWFAVSRDESTGGVSDDIKCN